MANKNLTFKFFAKDNASKTMKSLSDNGRRMGDTLGKVGVGIGVAFAAGAAVMIKAGFDAVESLKRLEVIGAQTTAVINSTGGAAGVTAEQVRALADSLERTTATESEAIQEGANLLLTFTNLRNGAGKNERVFDRATELMVDMARAMGTDASGSAIQLGKALNDPVAGIAALTRVGVQFSDEQKNMIRSLAESGDLMGAQQIILNELETQFGGSGAAYASTLAGQIDTLNNNIGATAETIVGTFMPDLQSALTWMNGDGLVMLEGFAEWFRTVGLDAIRGFADKIGEMSENGTLVPAVVAGLVAITGAQLGLNAAMLANPAGLVLLGLAAIAALGAAIIINWNAITKVIASTTGGFVNGMISIALGAARGIEGVVNALLRGLNAVMGPVNAVLGLLGMSRINLPMSVSFTNGIAAFASRVQGLTTLAGSGGINAAQNYQVTGGGGLPKIGSGGQLALAKGGIVMPTPGGVTATIAEAGQAEAVIPLSASNLARYGLGGGGGDTYVTIHGFVGTDRESVVRAIVRGIADAKKTGIISRTA
jgi:hypothetical protein